MVGLDGTVYENYGKSFKEPFWESVFDANVSIQQFTGIQDHNGIDIYEGDILGYPSDYEDKTLTEIRWMKAYAGEGWCEVTIRNHHGVDQTSEEPDDFYGGIGTDNYKLVVGNIFQSRGDLKLL